MDAYASFYQRSIDDRDGFWREQAQLIDWHDVEAIVEIQTECTILNSLPEITIRSGHKADIHFDRLRTTNTADLTLLKCPQKLDLGKRWNISDFIEEQRSTVR